MPSDALSHLPGRLQDVDTLHAIADGHAEGSTESLAACRGAIVLTYAAFEGFVEDLFAELLVALVTADPTVMGQLEDRLTRFFSNPSLGNVDRLFMHLYSGEIMSGVSWGTVDETWVRTTFGLLKQSRHEIAHGQKQPTVAPHTVARYKALVEGIASWLDDRAATIAQEITGVRPW